MQETEQASVVGIIVASVVLVILIIVIVVVRIACGSSTGTSYYGRRYRFHHGVHHRHRGFRIGRRHRHC